MHVMPCSCEVLLIQIEKGSLDHVGVAYIAFVRLGCLLQNSFPALNPTYCSAQQSMFSAMGRWPSFVHSCLLPFLSVVAAHLSAKEAGDMSTLFDVGGIIGMLDWFPWSLLFISASQSRKRGGVGAVSWQPRAGMGRKHLGANSTQRIFNIWVASSLICTSWSIFWLQNNNHQTPFLHLNLDCWNESRATKSWLEKSGWSLDVSQQLRNFLCVFAAVPFLQAALVESSWEEEKLEWVFV